MEDLWCASWRFAGLPLGRSAKLRSLLGEQPRQAHGRFAGFPAWEASYAELPALSHNGIELCAVRAYFSDSNAKARRPHSAWEKRGFNELEES